MKPVYIKFENLFGAIKIKRNDFFIKSKGADDRKFMEFILNLKTLVIF